MQFSEWLDEFEHEYLEELLVELEEPEMPEKVAAIAKIDVDQLEPPALQLLAKWFGVSHLNPMMWKDAIKRVRQNRLQAGHTRDPSQKDVVDKIKGLLRRRGTQGGRWIKREVPSLAGRHYSATIGQ